MNKSSTLNGIWLSVTVAAFAGGYLLANKDGTGKALSNNGASTNLVSPSAGTSGPQGSRSSSVSKKSQTETKNSLIGEAFGIEGRAISDYELETIAKEAFSDPNPVKRQLAFARLLEGITPENAEAIRDQMRNGRAGGDQWQLFQYAWGAVDGEGAIAAAGEIERKEWRDRAVSQALSGWASGNPQGRHQLVQFD